MKSDIPQPTWEDEYYTTTCLLERILREGKNIKEVKEWIRETLEELGEYHDD